MPTTSLATSKPPPNEDRPSRTRGILIATTVVVALLGVGLVVVSNLGPSGPAGAQRAPVEFRPLAGAGSDTTNQVLRALSVNVRDIMSYDPLPAGSITTKDPAHDPDCTLARPSNDGAAVEALVKQQGSARLASTEPCLDFARSTVNSSGDAGLASAGLTYIPFARDAVTFAQRRDSTNPHSATRADLAAIFSCTAPEQSSYRPLLPGFGSGLRTSFLASLGLADSVGFVQANPCVSEVKDANGVSESFGQALTDARDIAPYSVAQYLAQTNHVIADVHGTAVLGLVDGRSPMVPNPQAPVGMAQRVDSRNGHITTALLNQLYSCTSPKAQAAFRPLLPPPGSTVRATFLASVGLTDSPDFVTAHPCVTQTDSENSGVALTDPRDIVPYSVQQYLAQTNGTAADGHGATVLVSVGGAAPIVPNTAFPFVHDVYNVVPTDKLAQPPTSTAFVGPASAVCAGAGTITRYGFLVAPNCGDTTVHTSG